MTAVWPKYEENLLANQLMLSGRAHPVLFSLGFSNWELEKINTLFIKTVPALQLFDN